MSAPAPDPAPVTTMATVLRRMVRPLLVVVDGSQFEDVGAEMQSAGLQPRALFIATARDHAAAGPWLSVIEDDAAIEPVLSMALDRHACVFWSCDAGPEALFQHLRRLSHVEMPVWAAAGKSGPDDPTEERHEAVLFRHWDPRVLGLVMPLLDPGQFSGVLGPAQELVFGTTDAKGAMRPRRAIRSDDLPPPQPGTLRLRPEQIEALDAAMQARTRHRIADYLRQASPEQTAAMTEPELHGAAASCMAEAAGMGVSGERGMALWAYMRLTSRSDLGQEPLVRRFLADPQQGRTPNHRMQALFDLRGRALQGRR